jgi:hypothetical protein
VLADTIGMIETIQKAATEGNLTTVKCRDKVTGEEVEILCLEIPGGLQPIGRLYYDVDYAMADVASPRGYSDKRILH